MALKSFLQNTYVGGQSRVPSGYNFRPQSIAKPNISTPYGPGYTSGKGPITVSTPLGPQGNILGASNTQGGGRNVYTNYNPAPQLEPNPEQPNLDFDALIAPALSALGDAETATQSAYTANVGEIEQGTQSTIGKQKAYQAGEEAIAGRQKTVKGQEAESAVAEARRQYAEIQQGIQGLYGGSTGTGAFATELAGRQALGNIGQIRTSLANAIQSIDDRLGQVRQLGELVIQDAESKAMAMKQRAKAELDSSLAQIRTTKGELQSRKAELARQAWQFYQTQVADVNARNAAFKQDIVQRALDAEQTLANARTRAADIAQNYVADLGEVEKLTSPIVGVGITSASYKPGRGYTDINVGRLKTTPEEDQDIFAGG